MVGFFKPYYMKLYAWFLRLISPGYSCCAKCKIPWNHCNHKTVYHSDTSGTFATCDKCWANSSLYKLKEYYTKVYQEQESQIIKAGYKMDHSLEHMLNCVEKEFYKTHV